MRKFRDVLRRRTGVAGLTLGRVPLGPNSLISMEALLGLVRNAGLADHDVARAGDLFGLYLGAFVHEEDMAAKSASGFPAEDLARMFEGWLAALPRLNSRTRWHWQQRSRQDRSTSVSSGASTC